MNYDKLSVVYKTSPGSDWVELKKLSETARNKWAWLEEEIDLPEEALTEAMQIAFYYDDSNEHGWGAGVDNVELFHNTTSVNTLSLDSEILVFPNPNNGIFDIQIKGIDEPNIMIFVYNIEGQLVLERAVKNLNNNHLERVNLSGEAKGIYQLLIKSGPKEYKGKITIQ